MASSLDLARRDLQTVWHPCTQMKDHEWLPMIPIARGEGVWLHDADGRRHITEVRQHGMIVAVELARDGIEAATCD